MSNSWAAANGLITPDLLSRSAPDLSLEHSYLLNTLAIVSHKANDLLRRIPPLEQYLVNENNPSKEKRKNRKQLGWLKCQLAEASRQEQTIHQRLGQLAWEIQQRQRVILLDEERRIYAQQSLSSSSSSSNEANLQLNPTAPEFLPSNARRHYWTAPGMQASYFPVQTYPTRNEPYASLDEIVSKSTFKDLATRTTHIEDIGNKDIDTGTPNSGTDPVLADDASQTSDSTYAFDCLPLVVHRSSSTSDLTGSLSTDRRNSLPSPTDLENYIGCI